MTLPASKPLLRQSTLDSLRSEKSWPFVRRTRCNLLSRCFGRVDAPERPLYHSRLLALLELAFEKPVICPFFGGQFCVGALLCYTSAFEDDDGIGFFDGAEAMADGDDRFMVGFRE